MIKVAYISPSLSNQYDEEVIVVEKETWEEITSQMEAILDNYYTDNGWSGEVNLKVRFENVTKERLSDLLMEVEEL